MTKFILPLLLVICTAVPSYAQEVTIPNKIESTTGRLIKIDAKTTAKEVTWIKPVNDDVDFLPIVSENSNSLVFVAGQPGTYKIIVITKDKGGYYGAACDVIVTGQPRTALDKSAPPVLVATFDSKIVDAWKTTPTADKAKMKTYQAWVTELSTTLKGNSGKSFKTVGDFRKTMLDSRKNLIGDSLQPVVLVIDDDMHTMFPQADSVAMDEALRTRFADALTKYAKALENCK